MNQENQKQDNKFKNFISQNKVKVIIGIILLLIGSYLLYNYYDPAFSDQSTDVNNHKELEEEREDEDGEKNNLEEADSNDTGGGLTENETEDENNSDRKENTEKIDSNDSDNNIENEIDKENSDFTEGTGELDEEKNSASGEENIEKKNGNSFNSIYREKFSEPWLDFRKSVEENLDDLFNEGSQEKGDLSQYNIMVAGVDNSRYDDESEFETDSIMIISFSPAQNKVEIYAIKTDLMVEDRPLRNITSPDLMDSVAEVYGEPIDYYFFAGYNGFTKIIDELNGIEVMLEDDLKVEGLELNLNKGKNTLTGKEALDYSRWLNPEKGQDDRIRRQIEVIRGIKNKLLTTETLTNIPQLYNTFTEAYNSIESNMDLRLLFDLFRQLVDREELEVEYFIIE